MPLNLSGTKIFPFFSIWGSGHWRLQELPRSNRHFINLFNIELSINRIWPAESPLRTKSNRPCQGRLVSLQNRHNCDKFRLWHDLLDLLLFWNLLTNAVKSWIINDTVSKTKRIVRDPKSVEHVETLHLFRIELRWLRVVPVVPGGGGAPRSKCVPSVWVLLLQHYELQVAYYYIVCSWPVLPSFSSLDLEVK